MLMYRSIREIPNPYNHTAEIKESKFFAGRKKELEFVLGNISDFIEHGQKSDFIITGDKSIGKSSFLNIVKENLENIGVLVAHLTLTQNKASSNLLFFKELIDVILDGGERNKFLNIKNSGGVFTQREVWEELTDSANYLDFKDKTSLYFAKTYANSLIKDDLNIHISEVNLIKDFRYLENESRNHGFKCMIILIDEFQLLSSNDTLIQLIQRLMDEVENLSFILSGNQLIKGDSFEKIKRKSELIELHPLMANDIYELIDKPLMAYGFTREEIDEVIEVSLFKYLIKKGGYNPYYVNLIMHHVFDRYKYGRTEKLVIDKEVIIDVVDRLKFVATHHEIITSQLNASTNDQLEALYRLFFFQKINLDDAIFLKLAFSEFSNLEYLEELRKIKYDIQKVIPLKLYKFHNENALEEFLAVDIVSRNQAAEIKYLFKGDSIDELYLSQLIESRINVELPLKSHSDIFEHYAEKLRLHLIKRIKESVKPILEIKRSRIQVSYSFLEKSKDSEITSDIIKAKIQTIRNIASLTELSAKDYSDISNSLSNTNLSQLTIFAKKPDKDLCFCFLFVKVKVRYKIVKYEIFIPIDVDNLDNLVLLVQENIGMMTFPSHYEIEIVDSSVIGIQPDMVALLKYVDMQNLNVRLVQYVFRGDFDKAIKLQIIANNLQGDPLFENNIGFLHMNNRNLNVAQKYFDRIQILDQVSLCNLAYLSYLKGDIESSEQLLSESMKKLKSSKSGDVILRAMNQILLPVELRTKLPANFDLIFNPGQEIITFGNAAIIASFGGHNHGIELLKEASLVGNFDVIYRIRYEYFLHYNLKQHEIVKIKLLEFENAIKNVSVFDYFNSSLQKDKKIFGLSI